MSNLTTFADRRTLSKIASEVDDKQPLDDDLTSWAALVRAAGFDTFVETPSSANLHTLITDETGDGKLVFGTVPTLLGVKIGAGSFITVSGGEGAAYGNTTNGLFIYGSGSSYDLTILNKNGSLIARVPTGTNVMEFEQAIRFRVLPTNAANDAAAAAAGVAVGEVYRNGSVLMVRVA